MIAVQQSVVQQSIHVESLLYDLLYDLLTYDFHFCFNHAGHLRRGGMEAVASKLS